jgi:hypothetical protein
LREYFLALPGYHGTKEEPDEKFEPELPMALHRSANRGLPKIALNPLTQDSPIVLCKSLSDKELQYGLRIDFGLFLGYILRLASGL